MAELVYQTIGQLLDEQSKSTRRMKHWSMLTEIYA